YRYEHAHNDYLEALVEGGIVRLALGLLVIGLVFRVGWRAYRRHAGSWVGGLVLGALLAFATLVIHSLVDFGLHIPAIAVLAVVMCAYLSGLGRRGVEPESGDPGKSSHVEYSLRLGGLAPVLGAATAVGVALLLYAQGGAARASQGLRHLAARAEEEA